MAVSIVSRALDLLYPRRCVGCGAFGENLCAACLASMTAATGAGRCPNCRARWDGDGNCPRCLSWDALDGALAPFEMEGAARRAVHALKFRGVRVLAGPMAESLAPELRGMQIDAVYAMPLHPARRRRRGFNQAEVIARRLPWPQIGAGLERVRNTPRQVGLHERERRRNVAGAFAYTGPPLAGRVVAILDDVITTGATANECARVLRDHGARRVYALAFARASYEPDPKTGAIHD